MPRILGHNGSRYRRIRAEVLAESDICALCGLPGANSVDCVQPVSLGGSWLDKANLRPAHGRCNSRRGNRVNTQPSRRSRDW